MLDGVVAAMPAGVVIIAPAGFAGAAAVIVFMLGAAAPVAGAAEPAVAPAALAGAVAPVIVVPAALSGPASAPQPTKARAISAQALLVKV